MSFIRYLLVQLAAYFLDMGGFLLLLYYFGAEPLSANVLGKMLAGLFAFIAHRTFTFSGAEGGRAGKQALRYFSLLALNIPLSALVLSAMMWIISEPVGAKFASDIVCVLFSYWLSKNFVFVGRVVPSTSTSLNSVIEQ